MPTLDQVISSIQARDELHRRDIRRILEYTDQEVAAVVSGFVNPATENLDMAGFDIVNADNISNAGNMQIRPENSAGLGSQVSITGGTSGGSSNGGPIFMTGGQSGGTGSGGAITIQAGQTNSGPSGGDLTLRAGEAAGGSGTGGDTILQGGESDNGNGGDVSVLGGIAGLNDAGGNVIIAAAAANASAAGGNVTITPGDSPSGTHGVINFEDGNGVNVGRFDEDNTALGTRFLIYDVDRGTLERVSVGVADSGGAGFKLLRVQNT